ncbi:alpha-L-rhamnosidase [candidate division KSB1 bacterium]|nr:alpha-L-rhamnosidase [candidate division KSB1 bacterium]
MQRDKCCYKIQFLLLITGLVLSPVFRHATIYAEPNKAKDKPAVEFKTDAVDLENKFNAALSGLKKNLIKVYGYENPVLIEGAEYPGIWLECGPLEGAVYGVINPQVAQDNHRIFFHLQRDDGYLPCWIRKDTSGTAQIQMVVPIAATAFETYLLTKDKAFLTEAYNACVKWDNWLVKYRNTSKTGLCEAFCEYDTGHDNSPRWEGLPKACPDNDARKCPEADALPYLAPDLSATVYGGRIALAKMAAILNKPNEAKEWEKKAQAIRQNLLALCFDPESMCFYDLDKNNRFIRIKGDALTRVLSEHVVDQNLFELVYNQNIKNPEAFWTPYPLPSIAVNDPAFVKDITRNSWGGASQALTALRAPRWFEYYGKSTDLVILMEKWLQALVKAKGFRQQLNPWTGEFTPAADGYSPAMLVLLDYVTRLHGVRISENKLEWTCILPETATFSSFILNSRQGKYELALKEDTATLSISDRTIARIEGPCRVFTDMQGNITDIAGIKPQTVSIKLYRQQKQPMQIKLNPDMIYRP